MKHTQIVLGLTQAKKFAIIRYNDKTIFVYLLSLPIIAFNLKSLQKFSNCAGLHG